MRSRDAVLETLRRRGADDCVLVVGGGINGIGVYRDLALQGIPALLVDGEDFASGTSAAPSRLIHGGLRYLETGEFALVRESVEERNHLLVNAPHQVSPLPVWVPTFSWTGGAMSAALRFLRLKRAPGAKGALVVRLGLEVFERFGQVNRTMPRFRQVGRSEARKRFPRFSDRIKAVLEYYDARLSSPERLAMELVADAERDCPESIAIPYLAVAGRAGPGIRLSDTLTGETFEVRPRVVVNCAGPWVDLVDDALAIPEKLTGGTKGSHLVLDRPDIAAALGDAMLYFETSDHRACLIYTLDGGHVLLGTTDLRTEDPSDKRCSEAEIDYLFGVLEEVLPGSQATRDQILFAFAGVRPLPRTGDRATGAISRDHSIRTFGATPDRPFPVLTLVGGKWTTYRACAKQIADKVLGEIGAARSRDTLTLQIGGGREFPRDAAARAALAMRLAAEQRLSPEVAATLLRRYGMTAFEMAPSFAGMWTPLAGAPLYSVEEFRWIIANERVTRLDDLVLRRSLIAIDGLATPTTIDALADIISDAFGWSSERREAEIARALTLLADRHLVKSCQPESRSHALRAVG